MRYSRKALPPPDDPLKRHEELAIDRFSNTGDQLRATTRTAAARARRSAKGRPKEEDGRVKRLAELRLAALVQHRARMAAEAQPARARLAPAVAPVAGASNWVQLGPSAVPKGQTYSSARVLITGRVTAIVVDPANTATIYTGTAQGGVWKTTDGGLTWAPKSDNEVSLAVGALAMDPSNSLALYAGTGEGNFSGDSYYGNGVLKTVDGGNSWTTLAQATFMGTRFSRLAVTPGTPTRLFAATGSGLYRSTDGGASWTKMTGVPASFATDVVVDPATPATAYAAFWGNGIYRCTNAGAATPTWTPLAGGLPVSGFTRVSLGLSPSSPQTVYALIAGPSYVVDRFTQTTDGGNTWTAIALPGGNIGGQGFYNLNVAVDPTTPDIVYLSGISLWKATRNPMTGVWTITDVGGPFHPDNHALAFDPANHLVIYAGSDGGIYRSTDGGATWSDRINRALCITQFEFIDQHPTSDAVVFGGTQDNGTEQYRNSPVFNHADDGDGGFCAVDATQPRNVVSTYYSASPKRSTAGGKFGTWLSVSSGIQGSPLFYPPLALDATNPSNIALGTDRMNLDGAQGAGGWPTQVALPGVFGNVSAIHYVNSSLIYAGTTTGQVYRLTLSGATWTATAIHAAPLPGQYIWDVAARPDDVDTVIVVMSTFGISHVWRGTVPAGGGTAAWSDISGAGGGTLPDIPANALVIDPAAPNTYYIATDIAVYRTTNGGATWTQFSEGLPNCAVFDLRLHGPSRLLRAATHGRGMWERRLDVASMSAVDLYLRDHLMDTGRTSPSLSGVPAAFEDPLHYVALGDTLWWWQCADIKVDALEGSPPAYQFPVSSVDYVTFESELQHRNAQRGRVNRVYVQLHNRGFAPGASVTAKLLYADASAGLPPLPVDFWTAFPGNSTDATHWKPIGTAQVVPSLSATEPTVVEWEWSTPSDAADHSCLLVVVDCPADPIPAASKVFDLGVLVPNEKRAGLKNLHVVDAPPAAMSWTALGLFSSSRRRQSIRILPGRLGGWTVGLMLPKAAILGDAGRSLKLTGFAVRKPTRSMIKALRDRFGRDVTAFDITRLYVLESGERGGRLEELEIPKAGVRVLLSFAAPARGKGEAAFNVVQEDGERIVGGNTFVLRTRRAR
jgi:photosystem II stability/assembly factor-like uncharacterized protein